MFAQVRDTFESGLDNMQEQFRDSLSVTQQFNNELQSEVISLKVTVSRLESKIDHLQALVESGNLEVTDTFNGHESTGVLGSSRRKSGHLMPVPLVDPIEMYKSGRINDALNCVLDMKSLDKLVQLLTLIKTEGGVRVCSHVSNIILTHTHSLCYAMHAHMYTRTQGPAEVSSKCDALFQLVAVQQLAADFALKVPQEVRVHECVWVHSIV